MKIKYIIPCAAALIFSSCATSIPNKTSESKEVIEDIYLLAFDSNGGSYVASQKVYNGNKGVRPTDPVKDGYRFDGWYSNSKLEGDSFDFNQPITANTKLFAKWEEAGVFNFEFKGTNCKIHSKNEIKEQINQNQEDVFYIVEADEDYELQKVDNLPDCVTYEIDKDKHLGVITINHINQDVKIVCEATKPGVVTFKFNGNNQCLIDGESSLTESVKKDEIKERVYYISPAEKYNLPTEDQLHISYGGSPSDYSYVSGVLKIYCLTTNFTINADDLTHKGYQIDIRVNEGGKFVIPGIMETAGTTYSGLVEKGKLSENKLKFTLKLDNSHSIWPSDIFVYQDGVKRNCDYEETEQENEYKFTISDVHGDIYMMIMPMRTGANLLKLKVENESKEESFDVSLNGHLAQNDVATTQIPEDIEGDYYVRVTISANDNSFFRVVNDVAFKDTQNNAEFEVRKFINNNSADFYVNIKNLSKDDNNLYLIIKDNALGPLVLNDLSFEHIHRMAYNVKGFPLTDLFTIGDTKKITLKDDLGAPQPFQHEIRIIGFNHDNLADGTGKSAITFEFTNVFSKGDGDEAYLQKFKGGSCSDYNDSDLKNFVNNFYENHMPDDIRQFVKKVRKRCHINDVTEDYQNCNCFLFPLALKEMNLNTSPVDYNEEPVYEYYQDHHTAADYMKAPVKGYKSSSNDDYNRYYLLRTVGDQWFKDTSHIYFIKDNGSATHKATGDLEKNKFSVSGAFNF